MRLFHSEMRNSRSGDVASWPLILITVGAIGTIGIVGTICLIRSICLILARTSPGRRLALVDAW